MTTATAAITSNPSLPNLAHHTGSERFYRHQLNRNVVYTEGAAYVADTVGAYWLLDMIVANQFDAKFQAHDLQIWTLRVRGTAATIEVSNGDEEIFHTEPTTLTDFPEPGITLWFTNSTILLPSEY